MLQKLKQNFAPPLSLTIAVIPAMVILLGLGTWQLQRLIWKQGLITQFEQSVQADPIDWSLLRSQIANQPAEEQPINYRRVLLEGTFLHEHELFMTGRSREGEPGLWVITPMRLLDGSVVAVNRGYIEIDYRDQAGRLDGLFAGVVRIEAMYRRAVPPTGLRAWVLPENDPIKNTWYTWDMPMMRAQTVDNLAQDYYFMDAREGEPKPYGKQWQFRLVNNHLQYAVIWFGLALGLLVIYGIFGYRKAQGWE